jgi:sterol desaturase/sphingolipid hydroxylase (fatty acid hydroxylase superfamily)
MEKYWHIIQKGYSDYWNYLSNELLVPSWHNYFYWLMGLSLLVWFLEIIFPWRKQQAIFRKDFWMDGFYMFFNFFIFSLIGYNALTDVVVNIWNDGLATLGITNTVAINIQALPVWFKLIFMFVLADFIQWNIHRLLHKNKTLWQFHKVHHSVQEMGFAAHFRFHFMETIIYKTLQYIPLSFLGFGLTDFFIIHIIGVAIGHLNHSNLNWTYGPLQYIFNNPRMHLQHHAKELPADSYGVNFGLSLSIWDYIFKTAYIPSSNGKTALGFDEVQHYPKTFWQQLWFPFKKI